MHLFFNMMSTAAIGTLLEKRFGTLKHAITILWGILLTSVFYTLWAFIAYKLFGIEKPMYQHSVGFSGVIFQLSVLEANLSPATSRSVFGFFFVPAYLYPWALLVVLQFIMPQVSFIGHLAGIIVGSLQLYGAFDIIMPDDEYFREMEKWQVFRFITSRDGFVKTPTEGTFASNNLNLGDLLGSFLLCLGVVLKFTKDVVATFKVIIFGYGTRQNENLGLNRNASVPWGVGGGTIADDGGIDEDDWVGLPPPPSPDDVETSEI